MKRGHNKEKKFVSSKQKIHVWNDISDGYMRAEKWCTFNISSYHITLLSADTCTYIMCPE